MLSIMQSSYVAFSAELTSWLGTTVRIAIATNNMKYSGVGQYT